jgi:hypothetical protein
MIEKTFLIYFLILPISLGVGIFLIGLVLLAIESRRNKKKVEVETHEWETTGGKVISARLDKCATSPGKNKGAQAEPKFTPVMEFVYTANGKEYTSNNIFPGECENYSREAAQEILDNFPVNSYIPIRYDPNDPGISTLEDLPKPSNRLRMFGLLFTWFGISVCCFSSLMIFIMSANIL